MTTRNKGRPISMERKYQQLLLVHSGKLSLTDLKSMYRVTYVAATDEYSRPKDQRAILSTEARIEKLMKLTMTRDLAKQQAIMRLKAKPKLAGNRADAIASFATDYDGSKDWARYTPMVLKPKKYNPPRHGSSKGRIGKSSYIGFTQFNNDFDAMIASLLKFSNSGTDGKHIAGQLQKVKAGINVAIKR